MTQVSPRAEAASGTPHEGRTSIAGALLRTARPKQWAKNVLVAAAPGAAGILFEVETLARTSVAFVAFCLAASGTYFLNDAIDWQADRLHPKKRYRPVAAGLVPVWMARAGAAVLMASSLVVAWLANPELIMVIALYLATTILYSFWLKRVPVIDLAAVASGFVLRAIAGGVATEVPISQWFLMVASFGSLFIVAGKRHGETLDLAGNGSDHRATLGVYSPLFLQFVRAVAAGLALAFYCLWAFEKAGVSRSPIWFELSILPFVLAILIYALRIEQGAGSAPEDVILHDRSILWMALIWSVLFALGIYSR